MIDWIHKSIVWIENKCLLLEDFAGLSFLFMLFGHLLLCRFYFPQLFLCLLAFFLWILWGKVNTLLLWISLLMILPTDIIHPMWKIIFNVCVCCTRANSLLLFSFFFFSFQGIYKYLERCFSDFKQRGFVVGYDTRGQVTSNCSSKKYEYWLHLQD